MEENANNDRVYDPNRLLDRVRETLKLSNDAALARTLQILPPVLSKIRHRRTPVSASLLIRIHEETNLSIAELRALLGDRRQKFRVTDAYIKVSPLEQ
ncbi:hypothetical protein RY831_23170 [Noviherbaspirillum sp. CPCC 100848]|uniref:HTH cro/C1-type domain-containing protein n=1 Tax=Noviherbaspirillum album TaxID=3080276 RepID=A0ABU6JEJ8_9BURK|nr:hypothetical protein [Noviherbaspirillum sp. CPCC 100848]MEC4722074.1 hypothetical protein [Noviherbaspirillum sp. CPCC 100848]